MSVDVPAKLRRTAAALGCGNAEELCERFRSVNLTTECRPERLRAWLRGRNVPRSTRFFADWVGVVGISRPGAWIAECSLEAFVDELSMLHGDRATQSPARAFANHVATCQRDPSSSSGSLCGAFACYSHSWSPEHRGQVIRGTLRIHPGEEDELRAAYSETLLGDTIQVVGTVETTAGTVHMLLREPASRLPVFLAMILPPSPVGVLCGIMAGPCFVVDHSLPTSTRLVAVRVADGRRLDSSNRYLPIGSSEFATDLESLGLPVDQAQKLDDLISAFLRTGPDQVDPQDLAPFEEILAGSPQPGDSSETLASISVRKLSQGRSAKPPRPVS
jgi:hypothetical protein